MLRFKWSRVRGTWKGLLFALLFITGWCEAATVQVSWNANTESDLGGYKVYYGTVSRMYSVIMDVGSVAQYTIDGLNVNNTYYFAVTAYDVNGNESGYSEEVTYRVEDTTLPTATASAEQADKVKVTFSEPVDKASAELVSNYAINKSIVVQRAELQTNLTTVYLYTTQHPNAWYVLTINNVKDQAAVPNTIAANTQLSYAWEGSDKIPPMLSSAELIRDNTVKVTFSEALNQTTAYDRQNYVITPTVNILSSGIDPTFTIVYLTTDPHTPGTIYTLKVSNVKDGAGNTIAANSTKTYSMAVSDATPPAPIAARGLDATHVEVEFNEPVDATTSQRTTNYSIPSITVQSAVLSADKRKVTLTTSAHAGGNYTLSVSGVADAATPPNVMTASAQLVYPYTAPDTQPPRLESASLTSVNYLQVNFNEPIERTSAENRLNYTITPTITPTITVVRAILDVSQKMVLLETSNHADGTYTLRVAGIKDAAANSIDPNYTTKTYSYTAPDLTPPSLSKAVLRGANLVELVFSESLDRTSAENKANYSIDKGIAVQSVVLNGDSLNHVNLTTSSHTPGNTYTVVVAGIKDRATIPNVLATQQKTYDYPSTDKTPPRLLSVIPAGDQMLELVFDEAVDQASAETIANYVIATPAAVQIKTATLSANKTKVILNTVPHQPGKNYTIVVNGVKDLANPANTIAAPNNQQAYFIVAQDLSVPELQIADLLNEQTLRLTFNEPLAKETAENPNNYSLDNGITVRSVAPLTGTFTEVYLSTTTHSRGNYTVTVRNLKDQASTPNTMTAEVKKSYSYQPVDNTPPSLKEPPKLVNSQTIELVFDEPLNGATVVPANFTVNNGVAVERAVLDISGTRVLLTTSTHIPGSYIVTIVGVKDAYGGNTINSNTVGTYAYAIQDKTPPSLLSAELHSKNMLVAKFSEPIERTTGQTKANYRVNNNIEVRNVFVSSQDNEVVLETSDHVAGEYTLTVNGVCDLSKNAIQTYSQVKYAYNPPDTSGPALLSAKLDYNNFVVLNFDEALEEKSALLITNYRIEPTVSIYQAFLDASMNKVNLYTASHISGTYKVTVINVKDRAFAPNTIQAKFSASQYSYIPPDTSAPKLQACALSTPMSLVLQFNEPVARETAENLNNYAIDNGMKVNNAYLTSDLNKVILETSPHQPRTNYTIRISGIKDRAPVPNVLKSPIAQQYAYTPPDMEGPQLLAVKLSNSNLLELAFSEALDQSSAETQSNYKIDPSVEVLNASLDMATLKKVYLETTAHVPSIGYGIYVKNVKDQAPVPNVISPNPTYMSYSLPTSGGMADRTPPAVAMVEVLSTTQLEVVFTEPVDKATAESKNNYAIQDSVSIQSAKLDTSLVKVRLTTTAIRSGKAYKIQIANIKDTATKPNVLAAAGAIQYIYSKGVSISNPSRSRYALQTTGFGKVCFGDRNYTVQQLPEVLNGAVQVVALNEDKTSSEDAFLRFELRGSATVYVAHDKRIGQIPNWLADWKATGEQIVDSRSSVYAVYSKKSMGGRIILGGNQGTADDNMYLVFVVPQSGGGVLAGLSKAAYTVAQVGVGDPYYIDRTYTVSSIPDSLNGLLWIKTANEDKTNQDNEFLGFTLNENAHVYVGYDSRARLPKWLADWKKEEGQIVDSRGSAFDVLSKNYSAGDVVLGGNCGTPEDNMYVVLVAPSGVKSDPGISEVPGYFTLHQNYPNPFNPKTTIHYKVHKDGRLKITVFNLLGQTVRVLVDQNFAAGYEDQVEWNGTDQHGLPVASGVYFYRIEQDQFAKTRRMTLLK